MEQLLQKKQKKNRANKKGVRDSLRLLTACLLLLLQRVTLTLQPLDGPQLLIFLPVILIVLHTRQNIRSCCLAFHFFLFKKNVVQEKDLKKRKEKKKILYPCIFILFLFILVPLFLLFFFLSDKTNSRK